MSVKYRIIKWGAYFMGQKAIFPPEEFTFSDSNRLPDFIFRSLGGSEIRLSDYKGKKIIFVNVRRAQAPARSRLDPRRAPRVRTSLAPASLFQGRASP
jgi:hypothetical protein